MTTKSALSLSNPGSVLKNNKKPQDNPCVYNKNITANKLLTFLRREFSPIHNTDVVH